YILTFVCCLTLSSQPVYADDLFTVLELAMRNDPTLRQAEAQFKSRQTQVEQSRASLLPGINASGSTTRQTSGPSSPIRNAQGVVVVPSHSFDDSQNAHRWGLNLNQSLFNLASW